MIKASIDNQYYVEDMVVWLSYRETFENLFAFMKAVFSLI